MKQTINISGMTCEACEYKIQHVLSQIPTVSLVMANHSKNQVEIESSGLISEDTLKEILKPHTKYAFIAKPDLRLVDEKASETQFANPDLQSGLSGTASAMQLKLANPDLQSGLSGTASVTQLNQYYPLFLIAGFIMAVSFLTSFHLGIYELQHFQVKIFFHNFMTGFFLVFSFFKLLDVKAFAESFEMYDLLAAKVPAYGKIYPFIELALGLLCLIHFQEKYVYVADIIIMGFGRNSECGG